MACIYIYKGHKFNSELELDDFLLEKRQYESTLGDIVFSRTQAQNNVSSVLSVIAKDSVELQKKYKEWQKQNKITYNEDGDESFEQPPYIGVNKFLSGLTNEAGKLLFPEFREEEYWNRRYSNWKLGQFTESELEEFEFDKNNSPRIIDSEQHKKLREQMTNRWKIQAKTGTAIHNVLQLCFQKLNDEYVFNLSDNQIITHIYDNIESENLQYLNSDIVQQAIQYAKKLNEDLTYKLGDGLAFYPEFVISQDTNIISNGNPTKLLGIVDLLIVDKEGKIHILDYKTSIHNYSEFSAPKKNAYSYQLAVYQRMIEKYGLNTYGGQLLVAPIQISGFKKQDNTYIYDGIEAPNSFISINTSLNSDKMWENIDEFMPNPFSLSVTSEDVIQTTTEMMSKWFVDYSDTRKVTREQIIKRLKKYDKLTPDENGVYTWNRYGKNESAITATSEAEFVDKILNYEQGLPAKRLRYTEQVKQFIKEGIKNGIKNADFPSPIISSTEGETTWLRDILSKYCDGNWEIVNNELLDSYGLIMLKTKEGLEPRQIDFVRVSTNELTSNYRTYLNKNNILKNRKGLTGTYEADVVQKSKQNSLMVEAVNGNIELIETMLIINQLSGLQGYTIGNIQVVNPLYANGMKMSNEELLYCFNELNKHDPVKNNNIGLGDKDIKFASKYQLLLNELTFIINSGELKNWKDEYRHLSGVKSAKSVMDQAINGDVEDKIIAIKRLIQEMESDPIIKTRISKTYTKQSDLSSKEILLYNAALTALAQLKGVDFRQQLNDHDKWLESIMIWKNGVSGSMIDNPGNLDSETLNLVTNLVTQAYQNTRDDIQKSRTQILKLVQNLKKEKSFNFIKENSIGNQVSLYTNMYEETQNGDFVFKNPNKLQGAEKEFLEYALYTINKNRFPDKTDEELLNMQNNNDISYYRVPLALGDLDSVASVQGMLGILRAKLSFLVPKVAFERAQKKMEGIFNTDEEKASNSSQILYQMTNYFDGGEGDNRIERIKTQGIQNLEHNLETLLLKHIFAYSVKDNIDNVFPLIKSALIHISSQGAIQNTEYKDDIEYFENYIKNKILNKSIVDPKYKKYTEVAGMIKSAASKLTLAFAPVQMLYQPLQGLWTDISLMIRKPDGKQSFTFNHFNKALKLVYSDLFQFSDNPTLCSSLNEIYGINDMDMNTYVDRISTGKRGIWNLENWLFKFASRPDYYNRLTIFTAQMMGDGCLEAHSMEDGRLVYNWKKDKRFSKYAANPKLVTDDVEYNRQKALYYTIAKQFIAENAKMPNGEPFVLDMSDPMPLPRAYTTLEAESMKSLADDIYGYYSHEKKSLILSTGLGSMWLQFKTYWSGKKNQYLQSGGVRLRGKWKHYSEIITDSKTGQIKEIKYYYQVDNKGNILFDKSPLSEDEMNNKNIPLIAPVMQWEGQWQEGIILTLSDMVKEMYNQKSIIQGFNSKWNAMDEKLRNTYRSNIKQFLYDSTMFVLGGLILSALLTDWLKDLLEDNKKNRDLSTGIALAAANIAVMSVKNSFLDFNFIESVGSPVGQWTPFAFEWGARTMKNWWNVAIGDEDFWDGVVKTSGGLKQIKPLLDSVKPDIFRNEREGGTFGVNK